MTVWCGDLLISPFPFFSYLAALILAIGGLHIFDAPSFPLSKVENVNLLGIGVNRVVEVSKCFIFLHKQKESFMNG
jgi:hypothetical protein